MTNLHIKTLIESTLTVSNIVTRLSEGEIAANSSTKLKDQKKYDAFKSDPENSSYNVVSVDKTKKVVVIKNKTGKTVEVPESDLETEDDVKTTKIERRLSENTMVTWRDLTTVPLYTSLESTRNNLYFLLVRRKEKENTIVFVLKGTSQNLIRIPVNKSELDTNSYFIIS